MTDVTQGAGAATPAKTQSTVLKSSVKIQDLNPKKSNALMVADGGPSKVVVGWIHGFTKDIISRAAPDGSRTFRGLVGQFEAVPADKAEPIIQSAVCYLGDAIQPLVETVLLRQKAGPKKTDESETDYEARQRAGDGRGVVTGVQFAFECTIKKASNAAGYTWELEPLAGAEPQETDPLSVTRAMLSKGASGLRGLPKPAEPAQVTDQTAGAKAPAAAGKRT